MIEVSLVSQYGGTMASLSLACTHSSSNNSLSYRRALLIRANSSAAVSVGLEGLQYSISLH